ncbi:GNAT family N-acetyltransferase [Agarivorans sp. QJM3NY_33]|uniref:GNAT family N-acetyltransferase n=1 Tax=Agarivorans sp. QJM3NY_33 TaxID=3421432 RepID=UPI003D7CFC38
MMKIVLAEVRPEDQAAILQLGESVNEANVVPYLNPQGQQEMRIARVKDITQASDPKIYCSLKALVDQRLVGYIAWRHGNYIAQLYVRSEYQGYGIGRRLVEGMLARCSAESIQLKASVNALGFYEKLGFKPLSTEQSRNGIRFVPMELKLNPETPLPHSKRKADDR